MKILKYVMVIGSNFCPRLFSVVKMTSQRHSLKYKKLFTSKIFHTVIELEERTPFLTSKLILCIWNRSKLQRLKR